uniref:Uncharacterized protein n=1 Tax=Anguilla anguilla TaxID=7936 RepID=A0A0E9T8G9_ANGAN
MSLGTRATLGMHL